MNIDSRNRLVRTAMTNGATIAAAIAAAEAKVDDRGPEYFNYKRVDIITNLTLSVSSTSARPEVSYESTPGIPNFLFKDVF